MKKYTNPGWRKTVKPIHTYIDEYLRYVVRKRLKGAQGAASNDEYQKEKLAKYSTLLNKKFLLIEKFRGKQKLYKSFCRMDNQDKKEMET